MFAHVAKRIKTEKEREKREAWTYLRVPNKHNLGAGAARVELGDGAHDGLGALGGRVVIADAAARALAATGRVHDGGRGAARVRLQHHVDEPLRRAVALGNRRLARPEHVHLGARLLAPGQDRLLVTGQGAGGGDAG